MGHESTADSTQRVVVVGGGGAGGMLARTLQRGGWPGAVVVLTAEPHDPYDRTMLSKGALLGDVEEPRGLLPDIGELGDGDRPVDVHHSTTVVDIDIDRRVALTHDGAQVRWDVLVLAIGARPRTLDMPGSDLPFVHTLRERAAWDPLRAAVRSGGRLVIIGGGLIGLEVAAAAVAHGTDVTVVEVADQLMGRLLPPVLAEAVAAAHVARGVRIELGAQPVAIVEADGDRPRAVRLDDGRMLDADAVLVSVGSVPRLELAARMGLEVDDGIVVDAHLRTSVPNVFAIGDVVRPTAPDGSPRPRTESWTPAVSMGQHVARHLLGNDDPWTEVPWMWSDQYDLRLQAVGVGVPGHDLVARGSLDDDGGLVLFGLDNDVVVGAVGLGRGGGPGRTIRGAQALVAAAVPVDRGDLTDPGVDLRRLSRG